MSFKVRVIADQETGAIIKQNPIKPEYGSIKFEQKRFNFAGNFISLRNKVCFNNGRMEDLEQFVNLMELKDGTELSGIVYTIERREPFYPDQTPKINPSTGNLVLIDGLPVFMNSYYDGSGTKADELIVGIKSVGPQMKEPEVTVNVNTSSL